jgi:hypothetical protein
MNGFSSLTQMNERQIKKYINEESFEPYQRKLIRESIGWNKQKEQQNFQEF